MRNSKFRAPLSAFRTQLVLLPLDKELNSLFFCEAGPYRPVKSSQKRDKKAESRSSVSNRPFRPFKPRELTLFESRRLVNGFFSSLFLCCSKERYANYSSQNGAQAFFSFFSYFFAGLSFAKLATSLLP